MVKEIEVLVLHPESALIAYNKDKCPAIVLSRRSKESATTAIDWVTLLVTARSLHAVRETPTPVRQGRAGNRCCIFN